LTRRSIAQTPKLGEGPIVELPKSIVDLCVKGSKFRCLKKVKVEPVVEEKLDVDAIM
jgi:hypothetical protein